MESFKRSQYLYFSPFIQFCDNLFCILSSYCLLISAQGAFLQFVEPITEERANRCLARIDLLNKIREQILWHAKLEERLKLCQSSQDLPDWWINGAHDKELLIGAAK